MVDIAPLVLGIVFDTYGYMGRYLGVPGIVFDTQEGGEAFLRGGYSSICAGYRFRYPGRVVGFIARRKRVYSS